MFGDRFQELREDKGLTQSELGKELGIPFRTIQAYENNSCKPGWQRLVEIAKYFNVSLDYLFCLIDEPLPYNRKDCIIIPKRNLSATDITEIKNFARFKYSQFPKTM